MNAQDEQEFLAMQLEVLNSSASILPPSSPPRPATDRVEADPSVDDVATKLAKLGSLKEPVKAPNEISSDDPGNEVLANFFQSLLEKRTA